MDARSRLAVALDVSDLASARTLVESLQDEVGVFKVGLQLFTAAGAEAIRLVHGAGAACFLDLKLHDIPATVAHAVEAAARHDVRYLTVHAAAGPTALAAAREAAAGTALRLLAVTVLTSLDAAELKAIGLQRHPAAAALHLARLAHSTGIEGLVTSPHECADLRARFGSDTVLVVPGIRPQTGTSDDQRRVATPEHAVRAGADLLVVGRPVRDASAPGAAAHAIVQDISRAQAAIDSADRP